MERLIRVNDMRDIMEFYKGRRVLVTGHTGFKGSWLCMILHMAGADVTGYSLPPAGSPNLYETAGIKDTVTGFEGDIRDLKTLREVFDKASPEIVFHLAAQPIVRESYREPAYTYETNVMGTVNILECVRLSSCVRSFLNVTTDKVYKNDERGEGFKETDPLDGSDPYSNSKSCSELVTHSYKNSFFSDGRTAVSTARAGNVIGGGDFAKDRIIPDCVRAVMAGEAVRVRSPYSTRPYQHVLEPLFAYLLIAKKQYEDERFSGYYNVGPDDCDCINTGELVNIFCREWGNGAGWINAEEKNAPREANFLKLDSTLLKETLDWQPRFHIDKAAALTAEWYKAYSRGENTADITIRQIEAYIGHSERKGI